MIDGPTQYRKMMAERAGEPAEDSATAAEDDATDAALFDPTAVTDEELTAKAAELGVDLADVTSRLEAEEAVRQAIVAAAAQPAE